MTNLPFTRPSHQPLVVCDGLGVDSQAMLVGLHQRGIRPDLIIHADVGAEREGTLAYRLIKDQWLAKVNFPPLTIVRYVATNFKHWPHYHTLEENILTNVTLPSIAYGGHTCSAKWKIAPINKYIKGLKLAQDYWWYGGKLLKAIGFEDSPHELRRACKGSATFATNLDEAEKFELWFPLQQWGWNRARCEQEIADAGLPVPPKSSCYFCTAMKPWEVDALTTAKLRRIVIIEARVAKRHLDHAEAKGWPRGEGVPITEGLWRRRVKGMRGATPKPGSMTEYIREKKLLPSDEIDRLIAATPTQTFSAAEFTELGVKDWQQWLDNIITKAINDCSLNKAA